MFDRLAAEEIINAATQAVSKMNFCEIEDRLFAVEGQLNPVPERAALPLDQDVRRLNGRDAFLRRFGPGWRYALFTFGDDGELNGSLGLSSADPPELSQLVRLRRVPGTAGAAQARDPTGNARMTQSVSCSLLTPWSSVFRPSRREYSFWKNMPESGMPWTKGWLQISGTVTPGRVCWRRSFHN